MAVIALASASGGPGVTTSALGLALVWPRPVLLVEADPTHGSAVLPGYLRGAVAPSGRSLLQLAKALRHGRLEAALDEQIIDLDADGIRGLIAAVPSPEQAPGLSSLWPALAQVLADRDLDGVDVIVDAGRLGAAHGPEPLVRAADLRLLVTRTQLPAVAAAHARAQSLRGALDDDSVNGMVGIDPARVASGEAARSTGLLVVGDGRPYTGQEIAEVTGLPVMGTLAWDEPASQVLSLGTPRPRRWEQSAFVRSLMTTANAVQRQLEATTPREPAGAAVSAGSEQTAGAAGRARG